MTAIVVIAYNRPHSLERLLQSIERGLFPENHSITLHISIDHSDKTEVAKIAENFEWNHGPKIVQRQQEKLGLLKHVVFCGDLTEKYGEIIVLEDDLVVAPDFYNYALKSLSHYKNEPEIAGISLFKYKCEENRFLPFEPLSDGTDVHFIQVASSWGQAWNVSQWNQFKIWLEEKGKNHIENIPDYMRKWGDNSWKRYFNSYLIETNRFFVFPSASLSSNFEDAGTHASATGLMQVPLQIATRDYRFSNIKDSNLKYDAYFEMLADCIKRLVPELEKFNFDVDLYGTKPKNTAFNFRLTTRKGTEAELQFSAEMSPLISNVIYRSQGNSIGLFPMNAVQFEEEIENLAVHYPASDLNKITQHAEELVSFSVIIPVVQNDVEKLERTLESLRNSHSNVEIILVLAKEISFQLSENITNCRVIKSSHSNVQSCLLDGLKCAQNDVVTWLLPGAAVREDAFSTCARIFNDFKTVHWILGAKESDLPMNRWSKKNALQELNRSAKMTAEGTFFKRNLCQNMSASEVEQMFYFLLSKVDLTVLAKELTNQTRENEFNPSIHSVEKWFNQNSEYSDGLIYKMIKPTARNRFFKNGTLFSLIYRRKEQLPFVMRCDQDNNSYYLNEY